ncbi:MAG: FtsX-like permease family protein [Gemmatimonadota bacterium]|nr:FtsX-like permease family protein [Gemmatimonadota bacterium]
MARDYPGSNQSSAYFVMPLRDALVGNTKPALLLLLGAVAVVLLIACANVANLLLARSLARHGEMALRVALGAGRGRLAAQLLAESLVLALAASASGLVIAHWGTRALIALVPRSMNLTGLGDVRIDGTVLGFALLVTVGVTLAFGLVALFTTRSGNPASVLVGGARSTMSAKSRRADPLVLIGASAVLLAATLLACLIPARRAASVDPAKTLAQP